MNPKIEKMIDNHITSKYIITNKLYNANECLCGRTSDHHHPNHIVDNKEEIKSIIEEQIKIDAIICLEYKISDSDNEYAAAKILSDKILFQIKDLTKEWCQHIRMLAMPPGYETVIRFVKSLDFNKDFSDSVEVNKNQMFCEYCGAKRPE